MAYSRTDWDELTAITPERLNNIENGIEEANTNITNGKIAIATALQSMNQASYSEGNTFAELANGIKDISKDANATTGQVLTGRTFYQGGTKRTGTMPNVGQQIITPTTSNVPISAGYHNGSGYVKAVTFATGNAVAADVLSGKTFSNSQGVGLTGTMPNNGTYNITPGATDITIPKGYHSGSGKVAAVPIYGAGGSLKQMSFSAGTTSDEYQIGTATGPCAFGYVRFVIAEGIGISLVLKDSSGNVIFQSPKFNETTTAIEQFASIAIAWAANVGVFIRQDSNDMYLSCDVYYRN